jgi:hypothetical protein
VTLTPAGDSIERAVYKGFGPCAIEDFAGTGTAPALDQLSSCDRWLYAIDTDEFQAHFLFFHYAQAQTLSGGFYSDFVHSCVRMVSASGGEIRAEQESCPSWITTGWPFNLGKEVGL